jgi:hypothetical protein
MMRMIIDAIQGADDAQLEDLLDYLEQEGLIWSGSL